MFNLCTGFIQNLSEGSLLMIRVHFKESFPGELDEIRNRVAREQQVEAPNLDVKLPFIHYTARDTSERDVWGSARPGLFYNYDDRVFSADARITANASGAQSNTPRWWTAYLTAFHGKPVILEHIRAGVNRSNGYMYLVFGYVFPDAKKGGL